MVVSFGQSLIGTHRLSALVDNLPGGAQRARCHLVALITAGVGSHDIDFVGYGCRPGTLLWIRPGQVHQPGRQPGLDATVVAFAPAAIGALAGLGHLVDHPLAPAHWQLAGEDEDAVVTEITQLDTDCARYAASPDATAGAAGAGLLRQELAVLLMRIGTLTPAPAVSPASVLLARLYRELEHDPVHRPVTMYARRLACSLRTLTRACLAITGRTAKQLIDERLALEARRLLATTDLPAAQVGALLGFAEPTNFGRFFTRQTGQPPGAFRALAARAPIVPAAGATRSALPGRIGRA